MTVPALRTTPTAGIRRDDLLTAVALLALALSVALRVHVAGLQGAASSRAGICFGSVLVCLAVVLRVDIRRPTARDIAVGGLGALSLCLAPALRSVGAGQHIAIWSGFAGWATVVAFVAIAEELLLRGALFDLARRAHGPAYAVVITTVAFGLLHVPVYGARVLPLDLTVGLVLGGLRLIAGSVWAPAFAHTAADLAGWWLR